MALLLGGFSAHAALDPLAATSGYPTLVQSSTCESRIRPTFHELIPGCILFCACASFLGSLLADTADTDVNSYAMPFFSIDVQTLFSLDGRIALVTGAGSGVGSYVAHGFAVAGAKRVYVTGRRVDALTHTAALHPAIIPIPGDVSTKAGCLALVEAFEK